MEEEEQECSGGRAVDVKHFESVEDLGAVMTDGLDPNVLTAVDMLVGMFKESRSGKELQIFRRRLMSVAESQECLRALRFLPKRPDRERFHNSINAAATLLVLSSTAALSHEKRFYQIQARRIVEDLAQRLYPVLKEAKAEGAEAGMEEQMDERLTFSPMCIQNDEYDVPSTPLAGRDLPEMALNPDPELKTISEQALRASKAAATPPSILHSQPRFNPKAQTVRFEQSLEPKIQEADLACTADEDVTPDLVDGGESLEVVNVNSDERVVVTSEELREMKAEQRRLRRLKAMEKGAVEEADAPVEDKQLTAELKESQPSRLLSVRGAVELKTQGTHKKDYIDISTLSSEAMKTEQESGYRSSVVQCKVVDARKMLRFVQRAAAHPVSVTKGSEESKNRQLREMRGQFWVEVETGGVMVGGGGGSLGYSSFQASEKGCGFQESPLSVAEEAREWAVAVCGADVSQGVCLPSQRDPDDPCFDRPSYSPRLPHKKPSSGLHSVKASLAVEANRVKPFTPSAASNVRLVRVADVNDAQLSQSNNATQSSARLLFGNT